MDEVFRSFTRGLRFSPTPNAHQPKNESLPIPSAKRRKKSETSSDEAHVIEEKEKDNEKVNKNSTHSDESQDWEDMDDEAGVWQLQAKVRVQRFNEKEGDEPLPQSVNSFEEMTKCGVPQWAIQNVHRILKWTLPTPVQCAAIPLLCSRKYDLIATAPTGSGKTGAFLLPALALLHSPPPSDTPSSANTETTHKSIRKEKKNKKVKKTQSKAETEEKESNTANTKSSSSNASSATPVRVLIVTPTRELSSQIYAQLLKLISTVQFSDESGDDQDENEAKERTTSPEMALNSSTPLRYNVSQLRGTLPATLDIVVATPQRIVNLTQLGKLTLNTVEYLILDEADRLFGNDFLTQTDEIISHCSNPNRRICLFSATLLPKIEQLARTVMTSPVRLTVGIRNRSVENVDQRLKYVGSEEGKLLAIRQLISEGAIHPPALFFLQSKDRAKQLYDFLLQEKVRVELVTSDRSLAQRESALLKFRGGDVWFLIATDVMARGMDFRAVHTVVNYDVPSSVSQYIHRVGRAGRAHQYGLSNVAPVSYTLVTDSDLPVLRPIVNVLIASGQRHNVPDWMLTLKPIDSKTKRKMMHHPVAREAVGGQPGRFNAGGRRGLFRHLVKKSNTDALRATRLVGASHAIGRRKKRKRSDSQSQSQQSSDE